MKSKAKIIQELIQTGKMLVNFKTGVVSLIKEGFVRAKYFWIDKDGYKLYQINYDGGHFNIRGQRLIWFAAGGKIPRNHDIDHKDKDRGNNKLLNLRCLHKSINRARHI